VGKNFISPIGLAVIGIGGCLFLMSPVMLWDYRLPAILLFLGVFAFTIPPVRTFLGNYFWPIVAAFGAFVIIVYFETKNVLEYRADQTFFYAICEENGGSVDPCELRIESTSVEPFTNVSVEVLDPQTGRTMYYWPVGKVQFGRNSIPNARINQGGNYFIFLSSSEETYYEKLKLSFSRDGKITQIGDLTRLEDDRPFFNIRSKS
jgi:hypothetical protein